MKRGRTLTQLSKMFPDCEVVEIKKSEYLVLPKKEESREEWEERKQRIEDCFALPLPDEEPK